MDKDSSLIQKEKFIKVNGGMTKLKDMEYILIQIKRSMKGNGIKIYSMDKAQKNGLMDQFSKDSTKKEKRMV